MKLAIIDIDGVVADATKRFERADMERSLYLAGTDRPERLQREATDLYWRAALNPEYVHLDTLIEGANDLLARVRSEGYKIVFLTSRPSAMKDATLEWLLAHLDGDALEWTAFFKAPGFQYVKTPVWKVGMAQTLSDLYGADEVIFVDDEQAHWLQAENVACYPSLAAIFAPPAPADDSDPFLPDD